MKYGFSAVKRQPFIVSLLILLSPLLLLAILSSSLYVLCASSEDQVEDSAQSLELDSQLDIWLSNLLAFWPPVICLARVRIVRATLESNTLIPACPPPRAVVFLNF